jgi:hypothetical protein
MSSSGSFGELIRVAFGGFIRHDPHIAGGCHGFARDVKGHADRLFIGDAQAARLEIVIEAHAEIDLALREVDGLDARTETGMQAFGDHHAGGRISRRHEATRGDALALCWRE